MKNNDKELRVNFWDAVAYLNLLILANNVYRSWVAWVGSVFPNAINFLIFKNFLRRVIYFSWKNVWEWKILELVLQSSSQ